MGRGHIVISADSHTEAIVDLKPFLPSVYHDRFEDGVAIAKNTFEKGVLMFQNMYDEVLADPGTDRPFSSELPQMDRFHQNDGYATLNEYMKPWPMKERLA